MEYGTFSSSRRLIFECKKSEKPILNLCVNEEKHSRFYHQAINEDPEDVDNPDVLALTRYEKNSDSNKESLVGDFCKVVPIGYSLVPAFGKSDQDIYSGLMGLIKASTYQRRLFAEFRKDQLGDLSLHLVDRNPFELHLAAMVVDAPLFDVSLDEDGAVNIAASDWSLVQIQLPWSFNPHDSNQGYCVHVITKKALSLFLDSVEKLYDFIYLPEHVDFMLDKRPQIAKGVDRNIFRGIKNYFHRLKNT